MTSKKLVVRAAIGLIVLLAFSANAQASAGDLDASFGTSGIVTTPIGPSSSLGFSVAVQPDGKIVTAGFTFNGANYDFAVVRYEANGDPDTSFGTGGIQTTAIGSGDDAAHSVAVQDDGKIVVAGTSFGASDNDFAVVRYETNGDLDTSFGVSGKRVTPIGSAANDCWGVAIQSDGKIVVVGSSYNGTDEDFAVARYTIYGALDTSFSGDGIQTTGVGAANDSAYAAAIQSDGKIVLSGRTSVGGLDDFGLVRYNTDGSLDGSFASGGKQVAQVGPSNDAPYAMAIQSDGKIATAGYTYNGIDRDAVVVRYTMYGTLDYSFGTNGVQVTQFGPGHDEAYGVAVQSDEKIVTAGYSSNGVNRDFSIARYETNGTLDTTFSGDGKQLTPIGTGEDNGAAIAIQSDGNIVVAGYAQNGSYSDVTVVRYAGSTTPANSSLPSIAGTSTIGSTLTCNVGAWLYEPTSYTYVWKRDGVDIALMTASTYTVQTADLDTTISCVVTAINTAGNASATSSGIAGPVDTCSNLFGIQQGAPTGFTILGSACHGNGANNNLTGTGGDDSIFGYGGKDTINGGSGRDTLNGGTGRDKLNGGAGADTINAADHKSGDVVNCGPGKDVARINRGDMVKNCEKVFVKR